MSSNPNEVDSLAIKASEALELFFLVIVFAAAIAAGSTLYQRLSDKYRSDYVNEHAEVVQQLPQVSFLVLEHP